MSSQVDQTIKTIKDTLNETNSLVQQVHREFIPLRDVFNGMQEEIKKLREENESFKKEKEEMQIRLDEVELAIKSFITSG
jgi:cell shape-determining protein MreC